MEHEANTNSFCREPFVRGIDKRKEWGNPIQESQVSTDRVLSVLSCLRTLAKSDEKSKVWVSHSNWSWNAPTSPNLHLRNVETFV